MSDIPSDRMLRWTTSCEVTAYRQPSSYANGHTRDRQGRLVSCEHRTRRVTRTEHDGAITVLADRFDGRPLNAPNDVVVASDGSVWFTDPGYGILSDYEGRRAALELPTAATASTSTAAAATATTASTCSPPTPPGSGRSCSPRAAPTCASGARPATGCS